MTGRIVPYMRRDTFAEFRRRRDWLLSAWWESALTPARLFAELWR